MARIGFDWEQVFSQDTTQGNFNDPIDYYRVEFVPYIDIQLKRLSLFNVEWLVQNTLDFNISNFRYNWFFSLILTDEKKYCPGFGWENDEVAL